MKTDARYAGRVQRRMKFKMWYMHYEIVMDGIRHVERVQHFRKYHYKSRPFQIGEAVFIIRQKYARLITIFNICVTELGKEIKDHNFYLQHLSELQKLAVDIDQLIELIEDYESGPTEKVWLYFGNSSIINTSTFSPKILRSYLQGNQESLHTDREKQKAYMIRKKVAWTMSKGQINRSNLTKEDFLKKDIREDGFESDLI
ncbi:uncharacterized protein LOC131853092 [Achroia grisella]|uniref:uncharacterized protein LOC131853092 n=1 Tax=Achroia grisella TaxID=688607 RepID=UPI0027D2721C|nr:uncharacterized protein LOC131853092 [Achroia grisella]